MNKLANLILNNMKSALIVSTILDIVILSSIYYFFGFKIFTITLILVCIFLYLFTLNNLRNTIGNLNSNDCLCEED
jgi:hypothetical protein